MAVAILLPLALMRHRDELAHLSPGKWRLALLSGVALACHFASWIPSIHLTTVAASAVLVQTTPLWVALAGPFVGERTSRRALAGIGVALAGTLLISGGGFEGGARALVGDGLALAGAVFAAAYVLLGRNLRQDVSVIAYSAIVYSTAAVILAVVMAATGTRFTGHEPKVWLLLAAITAGPQFLGHTVFNYLLEHVKASVVSVSLLAEPVGSTLLAIAILSEVPPAVTIVGGVVVLAGVYLAVSAESAAAPVQPLE
jgi:drug/metabolite transporter (DMT)-like permease